MRFSEDRIEKLSCSDGIKRDIHIWENKDAKAVFLTVHGLMDYGGNFKNPGLHMKKQGYALLAYDQHGHDKKRLAHVPYFDVFLDDLKLMLEWVKERYPEIPIFMIGHSMGGLILTHYVIRVYKEDPLVKGFILSAPAFENSLKTSKFLIAIAKLLSRIAPKMAVPIEDLTQYCTRDEAEYKRMREDEKDGIMATKMSARMGAEFLKAQDWVPEHIEQWKYPMLAIVPGDDKVINSEVTRELLAKIDDGLLTELYYPENYHESFNEIDREEVFSAIVEWCELRIK